MKLLTKAGAGEYLCRHAVEPQEVGEILGGFDLSKPMYEQELFPREVLYQYIRNKSFWDSGTTRGNWFCLAGGTTQGLAITDGVAGRRMQKFRVEHFLTALEGIAAPQKNNWAWAGGGPGGQTQLYVPRILASRIRSVGPNERW